jgi:4-amino-4-deoxy-L-arabinose transferase-like glycosyltransferase
MAGVFIEARFLRADMLLALAVTLTLLFYARFRRRGERASLVAFWVTIGLGLLDKGLLAVILPGGAIAGAEILGGELRPRTLGARLRTFALPLGAAIVLAIALPWHLLAGARNPGFLWDYVVNQHLLFFFDEKLPRDSIPDSLGFFWTMFVVRGLPWSLLLPAAALHAWRRRAELAGVRLLASWIVVVLVFFSLAAGRLEHYSIPALPAVALLIGLLLHDAATGRLRVGRAWLVVPPAAAGLAALAAAGVDPAAFLRLLDPTLPGRGLEALIRPALVSAAAGLLGLALLTAIGRPRIAVAATVAGAVGFLVCAQVAHERAEALFSWRPFAERIKALDSPPRVFFRAEDEYQLCGGLAYYLGRELELLPPPGWVPPTFLVGHVQRLFSDEERLADEWRRGDAVLVSDDVATREEEARLVPGAYSALLRAGERVLLSSIPTVAGAVSP